MSVAIRQTKHGPSVKDTYAVESTGIPLASGARRLTRSDDDRESIGYPDSGAELVLTSRSMCRRPSMISWSGRNNLLMRQRGGRVDGAPGPHFVARWRIVNLTVNLMITG